ncbi:hypothetical protein [Spartinivicinus ruber]|uniref:hypothetical protein n=1 Tax=Spartinivicinus ruber TaxID=2683272 RepID=UPI0013D6E23D|nr:hypothetical protein [Spartinivicinus ruber]
MAKYLYTTVYEQFTGQKPPEPQPKPEHRQQRKTHGHPYRMRHNMQNQRDNQEGEFQPSYHQDEQQHQRSLNNHNKPNYNNTGYNSKGTGHPFRQNRARQQQPNHYNQQSQPSYEAGEANSRHNQAAPKVVYKKRRQYRYPQDSQQQFDA